MDIYSDLVHFDFSEEVNKLRQEKKDLLDQVSSLENDKKCLLQRNAVLEKESKELRINISSLHKTSTTEIQRKDRTIAELRQDLDNVVYRRDRSHPNQFSGQGAPPVRPFPPSQPEQVTSHTITKEILPNSCFNKRNRNENEDRRTDDVIIKKEVNISQEVPISVRPPMQHVPSAREPNQIDSKNPLTNNTNDRIEERRFQLTQLEFEKEYMEVNSTSSNTNYPSPRFSPRGRVSREREHLRQDNRYKSRSTSKEKYHRSYKRSRSPYRSSDHRSSKRVRSNSRDRKRYQRDDNHRSSKYDRHYRGGSRERNNHYNKYSKRPKDCHNEERSFIKHREQSGKSSYSRETINKSQFTDSNVCANTNNLSQDKGTDDIINLEKSNFVIKDECVEPMDEPELDNEFNTNVNKELEYDITNVKHEIDDNLPGNKENNQDMATLSNNSITSNAGDFTFPDANLSSETQPLLCNSSQKVIRLKKQRRIIKYSYTETPKVEVKVECEDVLPKEVGSNDKWNNESIQVNGSIIKQELHLPETHSSFCNGDKSTTENTMNVKIFRRRTIIKKS